MTYKEVVQTYHNNALKDNGIFHPEYKWCIYCGCNILLYEFPHKLKGSQFQCFGCNTSWWSESGFDLPFLLDQPKTEV